MALTSAQIADLRHDYCEELSRINEAMGLGKADMLAAVQATDDWIEANQASYNAALPTKARNVLTATQKVRLFMAVARKRYEVS